MSSALALAQPPVETPEPLPASSSPSTEDPWPLRRHPLPTEPHHRPLWTERLPGTPPPRENSESEASVNGIKARLIQWLLNVLRIEEIEEVQDIVSKRLRRVLDELAAREWEEREAWDVCVQLLKRGSEGRHELQALAAREASVMITTDFGDQAATELEHRTAEVIGGKVPITQNPNLNRVDEVAYYALRAMAVVESERWVFLNVTDPHVGNGRKRYVVQVRYFDEDNRDHDAIFVVPDCGQVRQLGEGLRKFYPHANIRLFEVNREKFQEFETATHMRPHVQAQNYEGLDFGRLAGVLTLAPEVLYRLPKVFRKADFSETKEAPQRGVVVDKFGNVHTFEQVAPHGRYRVCLTDAGGKECYAKELGFPKGFPPGEEMLYVTADGFVTFAIGGANFWEAHPELHDREGLEVAFTPVG